MDCCYIHGTQRMNPIDFDAPLSFAPVLPSGQHFDLCREMSQNLHDVAQHFCPDIHRAQRMNPYVLLNHLICWDTTKCYYDFDIIYHQIWCQRCTIAAVYDAYVINVFNHFSSIKVKLNHTALFMH